ncbi:MAG: hypothetical protein K9L62_16885 [Vallitaleaceae bacterium]|nr:hypothetical protein [Vallitaleaceae bacterium]
MDKEFSFKVWCAILTLGKNGREFSKEELHEMLPNNENVIAKLLKTWVKACRLSENINTYKIQ